MPLQGKEKSQTMLVSTEGEDLNNPGSATDYQCLAPPVDSITKKEAGSTPQDGENTESKLADDSPPTNPSTADEAPAVESEGNNDIPKDGEAANEDPASVPEANSEKNEAKQAEFPPIEPNESSEVGTPEKESEIDKGNVRDIILSLRLIFQVY